MQCCCGGRFRTSTLEAPIWWEYESYSLRFPRKQRLPSIDKPNAPAAQSLLQQSRFSNWRNSMPMSWRRWFHLEPTIGKNASSGSTEPMPEVHPVPRSNCWKLRGHRGPEPALSGLDQRAGDRLDCSDRNQVRCPRTKTASLSPLPQSSCKNTQFGVTIRTLLSLPLGKFEVTTWVKIRRSGGPAPVAQRRFSWST
jgi:hypothetical protein